ncbi:MAG: hypothetical protein LUE98_08525 [Tannerellaceae bacterium]|nr:hypothetical protein [Tannerellaceae bacterium]
MKKLIIPYLSTLDVLDLSSVGFLLENKAQREYINVVNWKEYSYKPIVVVDIARSNTSLYLRYFVKGNSLKALYDTDNSPVHEDSCVEFFMKKPDENYYMNFKFNCIGVCDAARRESRDVKQPLSEEEYKTIRRYPARMVEAFDEQRGVFSWELVVAIPLELMGLDPDNLPEKILANFYKCADDTNAPHFLSWNPIDTPAPDFHRPEFFGELYF